MKMTSPADPRECAVQRLSDAFYLRALRSSLFLRVKKLFSVGRQRHYPEMTTVISHRDARHWRRRQGRATMAAS
jgi:hypothetical protein